MKIALVSDKWASSSRNGVAIAASMHAQLIEQLGHDLTAIGTTNQIQNENLVTKKKFWVKSTGTGATYAPVRVDRFQLKKILIENHIQLLFVEGWQTALTDSSVEVGYELNIPIVMISHGISVHPFSKNIPNIVRSIFWLPYKLFKFPKLLEKLSAITVLDTRVKSNRFYDRDRALLRGKLICNLVNCPKHYRTDIKPREERSFQIIVVGYFSYIKNQLDALKILKKLDSSITMKFIGEKRGGYYQKCLQYCIDNNLTHRVIFLSDQECLIGEEIGNSMLALSTSVTEVQPLFLLEAMASGTPFVSSNVGAIPNMLGGKCTNTIEEKIKYINQFFYDPVVWAQYSKLGIKQVQDEFNYENIKRSIMRLIEKFKTLDF